MIAFDSLPNLSSSVSSLPPRSDLGLPECEVVVMMVNKNRNASVGVQLQELGPFLLLC